MSKQMTCSFFPAHCSHIFPFVPRTFDLIFPEDVAQACPEQVITLGSNNQNIRRPVLALFALLGIVTGIVGGLRFLQQSLQHKTTSVISILQKPTIYWSVAFLSFGTMNLSGLFLHCLTDPTISSPIERPLLWIGDTCSTGVFGVALWAAALMEAFPAAWQLLQGKTKLWGSNNHSRLEAMAQTAAKLLIPCAWALINLVGVGTVLYFLWFRNQPADDHIMTRMIPASLPLEMWYAIPATSLASHALVLMLLCCRPFSKGLLLTYISSYVTFLVALGDPWLCRQFGNSMSDLFTTATLFFASTDVLFLGIWVWLEDYRKMQQQQQQQQQHKEKHA
ncbi:expressed unknown protein [Seminavis robusta]|uniref:Uncharacterized protein n=1 Tax=Seminavis robusta TaxID=568900 RepID=A0A9N8DD92_9STRA|nr:expressed unknown protein [Seminavis robusta]|eukprot:Sro66_g037150.1 n/a (335) ;mRNA; f:58555-59559